MMFIAYCHRSIMYAAKKDITAEHASMRRNQSTEEWYVILLFSFKAGVNVLTLRCVS